MNQGGTTNLMICPCEFQRDFSLVPKLFTLNPCIYMIINVRSEDYDASVLTQRVADRFPLNGHGQLLLGVNGVEHPITQEQTVQIDGFAQEYRVPLYLLLKALKGAKVKRIALEGGHIYGDETPNETHIYDLKTTGLLRGLLLQEGFEVTNLIMVDDIHPEENTLNTQSYVELAHQAGWPVDHLVFEGSLAPIAEEMIEVLKRLGKVYAQDQGLIMNDGRKGAHLVHPTDGILSCACLDAALCLLKMTGLKADGIVNVLPKGLKGQQRNTRNIVRATLGEQRLPMFNFFLSPDSTHPSVGAPHYFR